MILVFGQSGQVGRELQVLDNIVTLSRNEADLSNPTSCENIIRKHNPEAVINAAAYTDVDLAEKEEALATIINGNAPISMAKVCAEFAIPFVHISTDYVFDGMGDEPWKPYHPTNPQNAYGRSKLIGEKGIISSGANYAILRCPWIISANGKNFIKTILNLSKTKDKLSIVSDQIGAPTPASDVARACYKIALELCNNSDKSGIYHFSGMPYVSWYDFAKEIFFQVKQNVDLNPILSVDYTSTAKRPLNSRLECSDIQRQFGINLPYWKKNLKTILRELGEQ